MTLGIILTILFGISAVVIATIYFVIQERSKKSFEKIFLKKIKNLEKGQAEIKHYLDGLPQIKDKTKQELLNSAITAMENFNYDSAVIQFIKYTESFPLKDSERCAILNFIGLSQKDKGDYKNAINTFSEMLVIANRIKDDVALSTANGNIGIVYGALGEYQEALKHHQEALKIDKTSNNLLGQGNDLGNIGIVYGILGDYPKALEHYQEALEIHRTINNPLGQAQDLGNIGYAYQRLGDYPKALGFLNEAKEIYSKLGLVHEIQKIDTLIERVKKHLK